MYRNTTLISNINSLQLILRQISQTQIMNYVASTLNRLTRFSKYLLFYYDSRCSLWQVISPTPRLAQLAVNHGLMQFLTFKIQLLLFYFCT